MRVTELRLGTYLDRLGPSAEPSLDALVLARLAADLSDSRLRWSSAAHDAFSHPIYYLEEYDFALAQGYSDPGISFMVPFSDLNAHAMVPDGWYDFVLQLDRASNPTRDEFVEIARRHESYIATNTMMLDNQRVPPGVEPSAGYYTWANSPLADLEGGFDTFLKSLTRKRRGNLRTAMRAWEHCTFQREALTWNEVLDWAIPNLYRRHRYTEIGHAVRLFLFGLACVQYHRGDMFTLRGPTGKLVAVYTFVRSAEPATMTFNSVVKDEQEFTNNIGQAGLAFAARHYADDPNTTIRYIDPTCVMQPFDAPHSFDTYKRSIVNTRCMRPTFMAAFSEDEAARAYAPYYHAPSNTYRLVEDDTLTFATAEDRFPELD